MNAYLTLDQLIVDSIRSGKHPLYGAQVNEEARRIAQASGRDVLRVIDGRIQALRKAGRICADRMCGAGWIVLQDEAKA